MLPSNAATTTSVCLICMEADRRRRLLRTVSIQSLLYATARRSLSCELPNEAFDTF